MGFVRLLLPTNSAAIDVIRGPGGDATALA
jgi:hypothetical protein